MRRDSSNCFFAASLRWVLVLISIGWASVSASGQTYEERAVAAVLMGEAWSDGGAGMTGVAEVIHQRASEKRVRPLQVVTAHYGKVHAFSCLNGTTIDKLMKRFGAEPDYKEALRIATLACAPGVHLPGISNSANHFTRTTEKPYWAKGKKPVAVIGHHAFYRIRNY